MAEMDVKLSAGREQIDEFRFRGIHPMILLGTASDLYAGWIGQVYTWDRYEGRINRRSNSVGGKSFTEEVLPVDSVKEYFEHFPALEIDYTFYAPLLDPDGNPSRNFHVLRQHAEYIGKADRVVLKVPQAISSQKIYRSGRHVENETYLDPDVFRKRFYEPALTLLGSSLHAMVFEQEYQRKRDRMPAGRMASDLDRFFEAAPRDSRYHVELRTEGYLAEPVFEVLEKHGVGQVLSRWTWLPSLKKQLEKAGGKVLNAGKQRIIRLMTPRGMRYEDAYAKAYPFNTLVEDMLQPQMVHETVEFMQIAVSGNIETTVIINNRAGGNAPLVARRIVEEFRKNLAMCRTAG